MSERARILSWWGYVVLVVATFEIALRLANFAWAVAAALLAIVVLGVALKLIVRRLTRKPPRPRPAGGARGAR